MVDHLPTAMFNYEMDEGITQQPGSARSSAMTLDRPRGDSFRTPHADARSKQPSHGMKVRASVPQRSGTVAVMHARAQLEKWGRPAFIHQRHVRNMHHGR